jgi:predicted small secreted protein
MKKLIVLLVLAVSIFLNGCATIMTGTSQPISINSNVNGAKVYVDGFLKGETPLSFDLSTRSHHTIKIEAEGYSPYVEVVRKKASGWVWGNVFIGGLIGLGVDMISGGLYVLEKDTVNGNLVQTQVGTLVKQ